MADFPKWLLREFPKDFVNWPKEKQQARIAERNKKVRARRRAYVKRNPKKVLDAQRRYQRKCSKKIAARCKKRYAKDKSYRVRLNTSCRLRNALKSQMASKNNRTMAYVGCTVAELCKHLEDQFEPWMSWDNLGEWHIDHIRPCASFDLTDEAQIHECFHYSNLRPLCAKENVKKGAKWTPPS